MATRWLACACVLAAGCDRLLGLDELHVGADAAVPRHVTIDYAQRVYATNLDGPTVVDTLVDPSAMIVRDPSGGRLAVEHDGPGTFAFDTFADSYEVQVVLPRPPFTYRVQHTADALHLVDVVLGRTDDMPAPTGTTISLAKLSGPSVSPADSVFSVGGYATVPSAASTAAIVWDGLPLLDASKGDRLYDLQYVTDPTTGAQMIGAFAELPATLQAGTNAPSGTRAVPSYGTCHVTADVAGLASAMQAVAPDYTPASSAWDLYALPGPGAGVDIPASEMLHVAGLAALPPALPAVDEDQKCFDPVEGASTAVAMAAGLNRDIVAPGASVPTSLSFSARVFSPGFSGSNGGGAVGADQLGLPHDLVLAGTALVQDELSVAPVPGEASELTWAMTGPADFYIVYVQELVSSGTASQLVYVDAVYSPQPKVSLPAEDLRVGHFYVVLVSAYVGAPMAASGDFATRAGAAGSLVFTSPYFSITAGS